MSVTMSRRSAPAKCLADQVSERRFGHSFIWLSLQLELVISFMVVTFTPAAHTFDRPDTSKHNHHSHPDTDRKDDTMSDLPTITIQTEVPRGLLTEVQKLVEAGWPYGRSLDEVVLDALRRFAEAHRTELMDEFIREDVEWGLDGDE